MTGGHVAIRRDAGDQAAGPAFGETMGMKGGLLTIGGDAGELLGERMRRGLVVVGGKAGDYAGGRMIAGTLAGLERMLLHLETLLSPADRC